MSTPGNVPSTAPVRHCDVIMKGGITSGVVFPAAGVELAKLYTLKNIGGASAGAIAAALFAAAEYRRSRKGSAAGFNELLSYPGWFGQASQGGISNLLALFQPAKDARPLFRILVACLGPTGPPKVARVLLALFRAYPIFGTLGLLPAALIGFLGARTLGSSGLSAVAVILLAFGLLLVFLIAAVGGLAVAFAMALVIHGTATLSQHGFGLCSGTGTHVPGMPPPLTDWIDQSLDRIAFGNPAGDQVRPDDYASGDPLTFADLWNARTGSERDGLERDASGRAINLEVMTTNLTQGRPYRIPLDDHLLFYSPEEFRQLFSKRIVDFLSRHRPMPRNERAGGLFARAAANGLEPLPRAADLPVTVAVRMSLSFPLLINAVPLWGFDFSYATKDSNAVKGEPKLAPCWFSDGGITSNFPIHFFDGPLPRWPTFAFNLTPFHPRFPYDEHDETKNVWVPRTNGDGMTEQWSCIAPDASPWKRVGWFLGAIIETMHNWHDNIQLKVPGYRDRIAQIHLRDEEGGMNLTMPAGLITALSERGAYAARVLGERFGDHPPPGTVLSWDNHRWVRYRSVMSLLQQSLARIDRAEASSEGQDSYADIAQHPPSYQFPNAATASSMAADLQALMTAWAARVGTLTAKAPAPAPELHVGPRV